MRHELSLRIRLSIALVCAVGALAVAIFVIGKVAGQTEVARSRAALSTATTLSHALQTSSQHTELAARDAIGALEDVMAGFCTRDGAIGAFASSGPRGERSHRRVPPDLEAMVRELCISPAARTTDHPRDIAAVVVTAIDDRSSAWSVVRVPKSDESSAIWFWPVIILALAILALAVNTLQVLRALRLGVGQLEGALVRLERDLGAPIERPRVRELGRIADGLRQMASRVSDGRARERSLEMRLSHEQSLAALGRVVAGIAHEVRNPLAGIKLRLDVVTRANTAPREVLADVEAALGEVGRLDRLVTSLLSVARRSTPEPIALGALVDERLALLDGAGQVRLERKGDAHVTSDRDALRRAIDNLVRNAIEVSTPGEAVTVEISQQGPTIVIDVCDRGPGLADSVELFEPFNTSKADGVGLGTFIARSLIAGIGGSITYVREEPWTRMRITLPTS